MEARVIAIVLEDSRVKARSSARPVAAAVLPLSDLAAIGSQH